jgi:cyclopropane fatty-acyl-phospholipid synthase-like methyltransferase
VKRKTKNKNVRGRRTLAEKADRHELYEAAVQNVEEESSFVAFVFNQVRGRKARSLREDFSGTASSACEWVKHGRGRSAIGIDVDPDVLKWGRKHRITSLKKSQRERVTLIQGDVLTTDTPPVDIVVAFNFSYWIFRERAQLLSYFRQVYDCLNSEGLFFVDAFGGSSTVTECKERTEHEGFTYVWHQARFSPVTGDMKTHIHFEFPDGSKIRKAFSYRWRLWSVPEIRDLLEEAGFRNVTTWFEIRDDDGEGLGEWLPDPDGPAADPAWIANITAEK